MTYSICSPGHPAWRFTRGVSSVDAARRYYAEVQHVPVSAVVVTF